MFAASVKLSYVRAVSQEAGQRSKRSKELSLKPCFRKEGSLFRDVPALSRFKLSLLSGHLRHHHETPLSRL